MKITVTRKAFLLVGFEIVVDFTKGFDDEMAWIHVELHRCLPRIGSRTEPVRLIGFWQPWQAFLEDPEASGSSKGKYFFGVEVQDLNNLSSDFVVKVVPESEYAVVREERRGSAPKLEMYSLPDYEPNYEIAGDFEIFDDFDHLAESDACDVLVPIRRR